MMWFEKKNAYFRGFQVFDFARFPKSKTRKSWKVFFVFKIFIVSVASSMRKVKTFH